MRTLLIISVLILLVYWVVIILKNVVHGKKTKNDIVYGNLDKNISTRLDTIIKDNKDTKDELKSQITYNIKNIYIPVIEKFSENLKKRGYNTSIERRKGDTWEDIEFGIEGEDENDEKCSYTFLISCYFSNKKVPSINMETPILIDAEGNCDCLRVDELTQETLLDKLLKHFKMLNNENLI